MAFLFSAVPAALTPQVVTFQFSGLTTASANVAFGDGKVTPIFPPQGQITHTYTSNGTYTATATDPTGATLSTATVTVTGLAPATAAQSLGGPLVVNTTGNTAPASLPLGFTDAQNTGIQVVGSFAGGEGVPGTDSDSTGRINFYSFQKNQGSIGQNQGQYGEITRSFMMKVNAHPAHAFYGPVNGYTARTAPGVGGDPVGTTWQPVGWFGCQYADIDGVTQFKHLAIEVPDKSNGFMIGRLIFPFGNLTPGAQMGDVGLDSTNIHTNASNFVVGAGSGRLGICGAPNNQRTLEFNSDATTALFRAQFTRWKVMAINAAETGANAGSDFAIEAFDDGGNSIVRALTITRADGTVGIANTLQHKGTKVGFYNTAPTTKQTVTGSKGANAALTSLMTALATLGLVTDSTT